MIAPTVLVLFALSAAAAGPRLLSRGSWTTRAPALGIFAWQALTVAVALALVLAGLALALPELHLTTDLAALLQACAAELRHQYGTPGGSALSVAGGVFAIAVVTRFGVCLSLALLNARRHRRRHLRGLALISRAEDGSGVTFVDHDAPLVYCLPGRSGQVVVTDGAARLLSQEELAGVLAHERAHLRARHHLLISTSVALSRAFFGVGVFGLAAERISCLAEMHADDAAGREQRPHLAMALLHLVGCPTPAGALGAGGGEAAARIMRLARPSLPLPHGARILVAGLLALLLVSPMMIALIPAGVALVVDCCTSLLAAR